MKNLQLPLKRNWFEMTRLLFKPEDYREITPYFCNKFLLYLGESKSKRWWQEEFFDYGTLEERIENIQLFCKLKRFENNIMTLGYPIKTDSSRIIKLEHKGIEIRTGKLQWGAEPDKFYFVIKHGNII